jgi:hypothetical protein
VRSVHLVMERGSLYPATVPWWGQKRPCRRTLQPLARAPTTESPSNANPTPFATSCQAECPVMPSQPSRGMTRTSQKMIQTIAAVNVARDLEPPTRVPSLTPPCCHVGRRSDPPLLQAAMPGLCGEPGVPITPNRPQIIGPGVAARGRTGWLTKDRPPGPRGAGTKPGTLVAHLGLRT